MVAHIKRKDGEAMNNNLVVVLNDGETYSNIEGCGILSIPDDITGDDVDDYVKEHSHESISIKYKERMAKP